MPWDPDVYNKFKEKRYEPFYDLIGHVEDRLGMKVIDLGCGTGELTEIIANRFPEARVLGVDTSAEMLAKAPEHERLSFAQRSVEQQLQRDDQWDLIVANASLQWVNDHERLFPELITKLSPGGQLAIQMPDQKGNLLNQLLYRLVQEAPFYEVLKDSIRHSPVLSLDDYTQLLYANGAKETVVYQKVYPILASSVETLYEFISGSALIPYMEKLEEPLRFDFTGLFKERIAARFTTAPMVYAFKRIILVARF